MVTSSRRPRLSSAVVKKNSPLKSVTGAFKSIVRGILRKKLAIKKKGTSNVEKKDMYETCKEEAQVPTVKKDEESSAETNQMFVSVYDVKSNTEKDIRAFKVPADNKETLIPIVLLLVDNVTRRFELLQMLFNSSTSTVQYIFDEIPRAATDDSLSKKSYEYLSTLDGIRLGNDKMIRHYFAPEDDKYNVVVAIPHGLAIKDFKDYVTLILGDKKIDNMVNAKLKIPAEYLNSNNTKGLDVRIEYDDSTKKGKDEIKLGSKNEPLETGGVPETNDVGDDVTKTIEKDISSVQNEQSEKMVDNKDTVILPGLKENINVHAVEGNIVPKHEIVKETKKESDVIETLKLTEKQRKDSILGAKELVEKSEKEDLGGKTCVEATDDAFLNEKGISLSNTRFYFFLQLLFIFICLSAKIVCNRTANFQLSED